MRKRISAVIWLLVGALALTGCLAGTASASASALARAGAVAVVKEQTVEVRAREYRFTPARIRVAKGTRVTIRLVNVGTEMHEFELDAFRFEIKPIRPGTRAQGSFVADRTGIFQFACHVDGHAEKGMIGFLEVR